MLFCSLCQSHPSLQISFKDKICNLTNLSTRWRLCEFRHPLGPVSLKAGSVIKIKREDARSNEEKDDDDLEEKKSLKKNAELKNNVYGKVLYFVTKVCY
jgi:hypothetical protein